MFLYPSYRIKSIRSTHLNARDNQSHITWHFNNSFLNLLAVVEMISFFNWKPTNKIISLYFVWKHLTILFHSTLFVVDYLTFWRNQIYIKFYGKKLVSSSRLRYLASLRWTKFLTESRIFSFNQDRTTLKCNRHFRDKKSSLNLRERVEWWSRLLSQNDFRESIHQMDLNGASMWSETFTPLSFLFTSFVRLFFSSL